MSFATQKVENQITPACVLIYSKYSTSSATLLDIINKSKFSHEFNISTICLDHKSFRELIFFPLNSCALIKESETPLE